MIYHAQSGFRGEVIDLDTGKQVPKVIWFDDQTMELEAYQVNGNGEIKKDPLSGDYLTYRAKGRFVFRPTEVARQQRRRIAMGAPGCAICSNPLTLPGDDLCVGCRAFERGQRNRMKCERILNPLLDRKCEKCSRLATWSVADEVEVTPVIASAPKLKGKWIYERGATVGRRFYCSWCFKPPRLLDPKGEVIENIEEGIRPDS